MIVQNVRGFVLRWCRQWGIRREIWGDLVQEAEVAAIEGADEQETVYRLRRYIEKERAAPMPISALVGQQFGQDVRLHHLPESITWKRPTPCRAKPKPRPSGD